LLCFQFLMTNTMLSFYRVDLYFVEFWWLLFSCPKNGRYMLSATNETNASYSEII
jgi:hypothetical protein